MIKIQLNSYFTTFFTFVFISTIYLLLHWFYYSLSEFFYQKYKIAFMHFFNDIYFCGHLKAKNGKRNINACSAWNSARYTTCKYTVNFVRKVSISKLHCCVMEQGSTFSFWEIVPAKGRYTQFRSFLREFVNSCFWGNLSAFVFEGICEQFSERKCVLFTSAE